MIERVRDGRGFNANCKDTKEIELYAETFQSGVSVVSVIL